MNALLAGGFWPVVSRRLTLLCEARGHRASMGTEMVITFYAGVCSGHGDGACLPACAHSSLGAGEGHVHVQLRTKGAREGRAGCEGGSGLFSRLPCGGAGPGQRREGRNLMRFFSQRPASSGLSGARFIRHPGRKAGPPGWNDTRTRVGVESYVTLGPTLLPPGGVTPSRGAVGTHGGTRPVPRGPQRTAGHEPRGEAAVLEHSSWHTDPSSPSIRPFPVAPRLQELGFHGTVCLLVYTGPRAPASALPGDLRTLGRLPAAWALCAPKNPQSPFLWPVLFRTQKALTPQPLSRNQFPEKPPFVRFC